MTEALLFLLPFAFYSGWQAARKRYKRKKDPSKKYLLPDEYIRGINYLLSEQPDKALNEFLNSTDREEITGETHLFLGNLFRARGELERAVQVHQNLLARPGLEEKQKSTVLLALAKDYCASGLFDRTERVLLELLVFNPEEQKAQIFLQRIYARLKEWEKAIDIARVLEKNNADEQQSRIIAHYYCEWAKEELESGRLHLASQYVDLSLKKIKNFPRAMLLRGDIALKQNHYSQAFKHYKQVAQLKPALMIIFLEDFIKVARQLGSIPVLERLLWKLYNKHHLILLLECLSILILKREQNEQSQHVLLLLQHLQKIPSNDFNLSLLSNSLQLLQLQQHNNENEEEWDYLSLAKESVEHYRRTRMAFSCGYCGYEMQLHTWQCPGCHEWDGIQRKRK